MNIFSANLPRGEQIVSFWQFPRQRKHKFISKSYIDNLLAYNTLVGSPLEINDQHCL